MKHRLRMAAEDLARWMQRATDRVVRDMAGA